MRFGLKLKLCSARIGLGLGSEVGNRLSAEAEGRHGRGRWELQLDGGWP
jgi:hypothetical protein